MATDKETELHYFQLLNDIASGERQHGIYIQAWADKTPDPELKACLSMVADRETSHYHIFKRRIWELGYSWRDNEDPETCSGPPLPRPCSVLCLYRGGGECGGEVDPRGSR